MPTEPRFVSWRWLFTAIMTLSPSLSTEVLGQIPVTQTGPSTQSIGDGNQANKITVLAVVNGEAINRQQLAQECLSRYGVDALESMINRQLIFNECQRRGIHITTQDVDAEIERMATQFSLPRDRWIEVLEQERGIPLDRYQQMVWMELSLRRIAAADLVIDPAEVDKMLEAEIGAQVQVRMISLRTRSRAEEVLELAKANPSEFGRLAKDFSEDPNSASARGLIPPIRRHVGDPALEQAVFSLNEGEISGIIEVASQYLIVQCERIIPPRTITLEVRRQAEQRIVDYLTDKKVGELADRLLNQLQSQVKIVNVYNDPQLSQTMPGIAATVDNAQITIRELSEECIARYGLEVLTGEINRSLLQQHLKARKLEVTDADLQAEIVRAAETNGYTLADGSADVDQWLTHVLETEGATVDLYVRDAVWPSVALKKLVDSRVSITEEDVQKGFEANYGERVEVLAIVMQNQRIAQRVWQMATESPTEEHFGELASQYSEEPASKANFGRVPPIARHSGRPQLEDEAFRLQEGEISGLINVGPTWVIIKCLGRTKPVVTDIEDVRDELRAHILEQKLRIAMADEFEKIFANAQIDNFLAGTTQSPATPRSARGANLPFQPKN
jgi:parvulin-like peptidyl-prolyl isomerase